MQKLKGGLTPQTFMQKKIIIIEDEPQITEIYTFALTKAGFAVEIFKYGFQAQKWLQGIIKGKTPKPDLVLLDLILPDINGIEILEQARKNEKTKTIPFFIFTNYSNPELTERAQKLKVEKHIVKTDFTPKELAELIKEWFERT